MLLTARELYTAFTDAGVEAVGKGLYILVDIGPAGSRKHLFVSCVRSSVHDILADRSVEQEYILLNDTDILTQGFQGNILDIRAVNRNLTGLILVETGNQMAQGSLTAAGGTDHRNLLALLNIQANSVYNLPGIIVSKGDMIELDIALYISKLRSIWLIGLGLLVHNLKEALEAGNAVLILLDKGDQRHDRADKKIHGYNEG